MCGDVIVVSGGGVVWRCGDVIMVRRGCGEEVCGVRRVCGEEVW